MVLMIKLSAVLCGLIGNLHAISDSVVDISTWQSDVDFAQVKEAGIEAVIHKATEGTTYTDPQYSERRSLAEENGLLWGAYHYARDGDPREEADHFLNVVGETQDVLLVLSLAKNPGGMSPADAESFVSRIKEKTGRYPLIYGSLYHLEDYGSPELEECGLWIASWTSDSDPRLPSNRDSWVLWQYTDGATGGDPKSVPGIGPCSRDRFVGSTQQLREEWPNL